jgi:ABC-type dipeptide/oligopeptide/nickel transport system permease component
VALRVQRCKVAPEDSTPVHSTESEFILAGAVVIERVYDWPGLGLYAVESIMNFDYQATLGITLWAGVAFSLANLLVDITQAIIDPRVVER